MIARSAAIAGLVAAAAPAHAEAPASPPDPAALEAGDANLESTAHRQGMTFAASIGGGLLLGFGIKDSVGRGGSVSLRLGHVATPRTVISLEFAITAALHRPAATATMPSTIKTDTNAELLLGAQYYVDPSLWVRGGAGAGTYQRRGVVVSKVDLGDVTLIGGAALFGAGVDLARFKWAVLDIEFATSAMICSDGVLASAAIGFGVAFD